MTEGNTPKWTDDANTETQLTDLVSNAHKSNTKVLISVGGWSGSITFRYINNNCIYINVVYINFKIIVQWQVVLLTEKNLFNGMSIKLKSKLFSVNV